MPDGAPSGLGKWVHVADTIVFSILCGEQNEEAASSRRWAAKADAEAVKYPGCRLKRKGGLVMSRISLALLFILTFVSGCASSQDGAARQLSRSGVFSEVYRPNEYTVTGTVHKGCVEFRDPEEVVGKGPITRVEVASNGFIYGIRLYYGQDGQGLFHIGPAENELPGRSVWRVPEGERIVRIEGEIAGNYISRLRFFTDEGSASPQFGGLSGNPFVVSESGIGGLRTISGHVNKRRQSAQSIRRAVTGMTFHFGAPCYIKDIKYDLAAFEAASLKAVPERLAQQEIPNRTSVEQTVTYKDTKKVTTTKTLTFKASVGLKFGTEVSAGLPGAVGAKASFEASASTEFGNSYENTSTEEVSWSVPVRVPPGRKIVALSTVKRYQATVPFTYTVAWYWGTKDNILKEATLPGLYEGIHVEDLRHEFREESLD